MGKLTISKAMFNSYGPSAQVGTPDRTGLCFLPWKGLVPNQPWNADFGVISWWLNETDWNNIRGQLDYSIYHSLTNLMMKIGRPMGSKWQCRECVRPDFDAQNFGTNTYPAWDQKPAFTDGNGSAFVSDSVVEWSLVVCAFLNASAKISSVCGMSLRAWEASTKTETWGNLFLRYNIQTLWR